METSDEGLELVIDTLLDPPLDHKINIVFLVRVSDFYVPSTGLRSSIFVSPNRSSSVENVYPRRPRSDYRASMETAVEVGINTFHVR